MWETLQNNAEKKVDINMDEITKETDYEEAYEATKDDWKDESEQWLDTWDDKKRTAEVNQFKEYYHDLAKNNPGAFMNQLVIYKLDYFLNMPDIVFKNNGTSEDVKAETDKINSMFADIVKTNYMKNPWAFLDYLDGYNDLFTQEELSDMIVNANAKWGRWLMAYYIDARKEEWISDGILNLSISKFADKNPESFMKSLAKPTEFNFDKAENIKHIAEKYPDIFLSNLWYVTPLTDINLNLAEEIMSAIPKAKPTLFLTLALNRSYILKIKWVNPANAIMAAIKTEEDATYFKENKKAFKDIFENIYPEWGSKTDWKAVEKDAKNVQ